MFYLSAFGFLSCLFLGGGARSGQLSDALLQLLSIPVLLAALWRIMDTPRVRETRRALAFCGAILAVPLIQLVPLPPAIWTHLPGRETVTTAFELLGRRPSWAPISMAPQSTWLGALSLLPPLAVFLAVITLNWRERRLLSLLAIGVAVASAFLGLTQLVQGPTSPLRFFEVTNESSPVGFFANVNHFAALLYSAVPLAAAWLATGIGAMPFTRKRSREVADAASVVGIVTASVALLVLVAVDVVACSRAGVILMLVALFGSLALTGEPSRQLKNLASTRVIIGVVALALLFSGNSALFRLLDRFDVDRLADVRDVIAHNTVAAASTLMPVGAGVGAFVPIYAMFEKPQDLLPGVYVNHAHNDFLELWLETGVAGPLLLCAFLYWLVRRAARAWGPSYPGSYAIDKSLIRAAILIIALLLGHSLVDYPLRTSGVMAIMAFACALLIPPVPLAAPLTRRRSMRERRDAAPPPARRKVA